MIDNIIYNSRNLSFSYAIGMAFCLFDNFIDNVEIYSFLAQPACHLMRQSQLFLKLRSYSYRKLKGCPNRIGPSGGGGAFTPERIFLTCSERAGLEDFLIVI